MSRLIETLPVTLRFAFRAGEARVHRDKCMTKARLSEGRQRAEWAQLARSWHRTMIRNASQARYWYEVDLRIGKAL